MWKGAIMNARLIGAIVIFSVGVAISVVSAENNESNSDTSVVTLASNGSHGGSGGAHSAVGGRPAGISSGPAIRPGGTQGSRGAYQPVPRVSNLQPHPVGSTLGQRPATIQRLTRPQVSQGRLSTRPRVSRPNLTARSQPQVSEPRTGLRQKGPTGTNVFTTRDGRPHEGNWSRHDPTNKGRFDRQTQDHLRNWQGKKPDFTEACRRHNDHHHRHHNRDWWRHHCNAVVLVNWGFWGWSDGWWYPAWGYDPYYSSYEYDGPMYGYDGLLPDEIVANVQSELQRLGYYPYEVDGVLGPLTQEALANYQNDQRLPVTGAIDPQTLAALGFL